MKRNSIKYRFALSEEGSPIDVNSLTEQDRQNYEYLGCGRTLRPVLGKTRKKHFRHKIDIECSPETYLHKMGKILFKETYQRCLEQKQVYLLEYPRPVFCNFCEHGPCSQGCDDEAATFDLTKAFINIQEEKRDGALIPDLLLTTQNGDKIYVEIAVTHFCSKQKIAFDTKIIEFNIQEQSDLEVFHLTKISSCDYRINLINFRPSPIEINLKNDCVKDVSYFVVFPNGECGLYNDKIYKLDYLLNDKNNYVRNVTNESPDAFLQKDPFPLELERAYYNEIKVRDCYLCRYHETNSSYIGSKNPRTILCKLYDMRTQSNYAAGCHKYTPDLNVFYPNRKPIWKVFRR